MKAKLNNLTTKLWIRAQLFKNDISGSETTEKVIWIVVIVLIGAVLAGFLGKDDDSNPIKALFSAVLEAAQEKIVGMMGS